MLTIQTIRTLAIIILAALLLAIIPGCTSLESVEKLRDDIARLHERQDQYAKSQQKAADALPVGDPNRQLLEASAAAASAQAAASKAALVTLQDILNKAQSPELHPDTAPFAALSQLLPAPWRLPLVMGGAVLATLARAVQLKRGLVSIAKGIEQARKRDAEFQLAFQRQAPTFEAVQTPTAKRIIQEATSPNLMLRLPV